MRTFEAISGGPIGHAILVAELLLALGQLALLLRACRQRRAPARVAVSALHFLAGFALLALMSHAEDVYPLRVTYAYEAKLRGLPWAAFAAAALVSALLLLLDLRDSLRYRRAHLSVDAIRETVDLLPAAICVSETEGVVLLVNVKMTALCRALTGEQLTDAARFWQQVAALGEAQGEQVLVRTPQGEVWMFSRDRLEADGRAYAQIVASEMTAQYRVTEELTAKNRQLRDVQARMKSVAARERSLVAAREVMRARTTVHNQMGNVLLTGKYYLEHPDGVREAELLRLLEYNNYFLLGEAEPPEAEPDALQSALLAARRIGVAVALTGPTPEAGVARALLAQAVEQCAANAVRHAGGDLLNVAVARDGGAWRAVMTNNGAPPRGPIAETGGLAALRQAVESAGGAMAVESLPVFALTLTLPE